MPFSLFRNITNPSTPVIDTSPQGFTTAAGFSAAVTAIVAALIAVGQGLGFELVDAPTAIKVALIGLIGAGIIGWAIAATGDTLARAYALAHVTRTEEGTENQPAIQTAADKLAKVYADANPKVDVPEASEASQGPPHPLPTPLNVKVQGKDAQAFAIRVSHDAGKETLEYLVGLPGAQPEWKTGAAVYMPGP